jgi:hypothetical protein
LTSKFTQEEEFMASKHFLAQNRIIRRAAGAALVAAMALVLPAANVHAQSSCHLVVGHYVEHAVQDGCQSQVGLCIAGEYAGIIKGAFEGAATSLMPVLAEKNQETGVLLFTSDSLIHARVNGKEGDLGIKNAGAYDTSGGDIIDLQRIVGGTGDLAGASGVLRASGTFVNGIGESEYMGSVCLP